MNLIPRRELKKKKMPPLIPVMLSTWKQIEKLIVKDTASPVCTVNVQIPVLDSLLKVFFSEVLGVRKMLLKQSSIKA